jgi:hypothetical protein
VRLSAVVPTKAGWRVEKPVVAEGLTDQQDKFKVTVEISVFGIHNRCRVVC